MTGRLLLAIQQELQGTEPMPEAPSLFVLVIVGTLVLVMLIALWRVFEKADQPGWTAIIPFVNYFFLAKAAGRPVWWGILMFVPLVNLIIWFILCIDLAKRFDRGTGFGIGLALLPIVFFPILAFGDDEASPLPAPSY
jgi:hypothetical protein